MLAIGHLSNRNKSEKDKTLITMSKSIEGDLTNIPDVNCFIGGHSFICPGFGVKANFDLNRS